MIKSEFVTAQVHGSSVHGSRLNVDVDLTENGKATIFKK
jgi:hypothetical protein